MRPTTLPLAALACALLAACSVGTSSEMAGRAASPGEPTAVEPEAATAEPSPSKAAAVEPGLYRFNNVGSGLSMRLSDPDDTGTVGVWGWTYANYADQKWLLQRSVDGGYTLTNLGSGRPLEATASEPGHRARLRQGDGRLQGPHQTWEVLRSGDGTVQLVNVGSGFCVGAVGGGRKNGTALDQRACLPNEPAQAWTLAAADQASEPAPGAAAPAPAPSPTSTPTPAPAIAGLHTSGNKLLDGSGKPARLHGVNIPSLEWGNGEPYAQQPVCFAGQSIMDTVKKAIADYHVNYIRLPISQDRWMDKVDGQGPAYRATVDTIVKYATERDVYVTIDLHWSDMGTWGQNIGGHMMPDDNTTPTLVNIAQAYQGNQMVLLGAYNEPFGVSWDVWRNGGMVEEAGTTYHTPGIQALIGAIRGTGAKNVIVAGGLDWSADLTGLVNGYPLDDINLAIDAHIYPWKGQPANWNDKIGVAAAKYPLLVGEYGADYTRLFSWASPQSFLAEAHTWSGQNSFGFAIWAMHPTSNPGMLNNWCYEPNDYFGGVVIPTLGN